MNKHRLKTFFAKSIMIEKKTHTHQYTYATQIYYDITYNDKDIVI